MGYVSWSAVDSGRLVVSSGGRAPLLFLEALPASRQELRGIPRRGRGLRLQGKRERLPDRENPLGARHGWGAVIRLGAA